MAADSFCMQLTKDLNFLYWEGLAQIAFHSSYENKRNSRKILFKQHTAIQ